MRRGDLIVAETNFGCGSSREVAPLSIKAAGVSAVIAKSFARIFFRNAINVGLPVVEIGTHGIQSGAQLVVNFDKGTIWDQAEEKHYQGAELPPVMSAILEAGGLVSYLRQHGHYPDTHGEAIRNE